MPDDYFCPGCGNYSQKEPGNCPLCRTPLATLGDEANGINDYALENDDLFDDGDAGGDSVGARRVLRSYKNKEQVDDEDQDL